MSTALNDNGLQLFDGSIMGSARQLGLRNLLVNANAAINQRVYVSGTATVAANQVTLDRWRVITSGQSLAFAASGNGNIMTAPAGGLEQVIEGASIGFANAVINWVGTATCTVDGVAKTQGQTVVLVPGTACSVKFFGGTVSQPQIEYGPSASPFDFRQIPIELALCQRDCYVNEAYDAYGAGYSPTAGALITVTLKLPVQFRSAPTIPALAWTLISANTPGLVSITKNVIQWSCGGSAIGTFTVFLQAGSVFATGF